MHAFQTKNKQYKSNLNSLSTSPMKEFTIIKITKNFALGNSLDIVDLRSSVSGAHLFLVFSPTKNTFKIFQVRGQSEGGRLGRTTTDLLQ